MRLLILIGLFLGFTGWSTTVALAHGPFGFLTVALERPWAMQMLLDLTIALFVAWAWLRHDAKARGIPAWPYQVGTVALGSIAVLAYLIHRELASRPREGAEDPRSDQRSGPGPARGAVPADAEVAGGLGS